MYPFFLPISGLEIQAVIRTGRNNFPHVLVQIIVEYAECEPIFQLQQLDMEPAQNAVVEVKDSLEPTLEQVQEKVLQEPSDFKDSRFSMPHSSAPPQRQTPDDALSAATLESTFTTTTSPITLATLSAPATMADTQKEDDAILQAALAASMQSGHPTQPSTTITTSSMTPSAKNSESVQQCENCGLVVPGEVQELFDHMASCL